MASGRKRALAVVLALGGCAQAVPQGPAETARGPLTETLALFEAGDALEKDWLVFRQWRQPEFGIVPVDQTVAIRIAAEGASGGVGRFVEIDTEICPVVEWTWRVEALPETADLSSKEAEDVAAAVFFAFGDPGSLSLPKPVPTLRYVWATETDAAETIVDSPYFPGVLKTIAVRSGPAGLGETVTERRDIVADFQRAFGGPPPEPAQLVALYTDSDHGESPVAALYLDARALCSEPPGGDFIL
jgi:hypothetical protein